MVEGERRLAAIMFTDMVGYTALTQSSEAQAMEVLKRHNQLLRPFFPRFHGREVKAIGDSFLVEFDSALEALNCAMEIQTYLHDYNVSSREEWKITLRIGVHLGDVIRQDGDILGDAVNIASRIQPLADPEGVCISAEVHSQVQNKFEPRLLFLGEKSLKNVSRPVAVYSVEMPWERGAEPREGLDRHRIAVMPLVNMITDPSEQYFADGMTEELISAVSKVRGLSVISRTSVMHYKNQSKLIPEIGKELSVGTLLEGSVRKAGNRVRITVQLIDVQGDRHLWAENYDKTLEDVFAIQSEIATKIAEELKVKLVDSEKRMLERKATDNTEAYTRFLEARELIRKGGEQPLRKAAEVLTKAIDLDPSFAGAHCELARTYLRLGNDGYEPYEQSILRAKAPLKRALSLDPDLAEAHATLSLMLFNEDDAVGAEAEAKRAIGLNPSLPEAYDALSNVAFLKGDVEEGTRLVEIYYHLDPLRPTYVRDYGVLKYYFGNESEALEHWKKTAELAPAFTYRLMTEYYVSKGDYGRAKELHSKVEKLDPNNPWVTWIKGFMAAREGDRETALQTIHKIEESKSGALSNNEAAFVYYGLGDMDSYFANLNRAVELHSLNFAYVMYCPLFAEGRSDPRYQALIERMRRMLWPKNGSTM